MVFVEFLQNTFGFLIQSFLDEEPIMIVKMVAMWVIGIALIFIAIKFKAEPMLLLPIGFGCLIVNFPGSNVIGEGGIIDWLFEVGIEASEAFPILLFIGIGAMIDFGPLISNPKLMLLGGFAQIGIFLTIILALLFNFSLQDASAIGIIGAADGPTSIMVAGQLAKPEYLGPITVVAYSYMALVPLIQPPVVRALTSKKERLIRMDNQNQVPVKKSVKILFPLVITIISGIIAPKSLALIGFLMFGNLIKECLVTDQLAETAKNQLANLVTLLLGITIASTMTATAFIKVEVLIIMALGVFAFVFDTAGGVLFAKFLNLFMKKKINPMIGAAGISAFPMSARVISKMGLKEDPTNFLLMHAIGTNVSGQVASAIIGGLILGFFM